MHYFYWSVRLASSILQWEKQQLLPYPIDKGILEAQHQHNWKNKFSTGFATASLIPVIPIIR